MSYMSIVLPKLLSFLLLIAIGFIAARTGVVKKEGLPTLSALLLRIVLPCLTITLLHQRGTTFLDLWVFRKMVLWQAATYFLLAAFGVLTARLLRLSYPTSNVHAGCMVGDNYAFIVIPMIMSLFGDDGQQYIPICAAVDTIMVWTLGLAVFTHSTAPTGLAAGLKQLGKRLANPIMFTILGMLLLNSLHLELPEIVLSTCDSVGSISASLGLIYVGCSMRFLDRGSAHNLYSVAVIVLLKLLVLPFAVYIIAAPFLPETERIILMLIVGAPSMTTSCMIAGQYGLDEEYAATSVFVTTLSCLVTIPMLFMLTSLIG